LVCNAIELAVEHATLESDAGTWQPAVVLDPETERCHLPFPARLPAGDYRLRLRFRGTLNDKLHGFYRSTYRDAAGNNRVLAATQFEATDARRAFPLGRARVQGHLRHHLVIDPAFTAVSNTPSPRSGPRRQESRAFADTILMSTLSCRFCRRRAEATTRRTSGERRVHLVRTRQAASYGRSEIGTALLAFSRRTSPALSVRQT
jgi:puromycin-sensitive aminopeptidase